MSTTACLDPELLARFATQRCDAEEWRSVLRHLSDCDLCRRQAALVAEEIPENLPLDSEILPVVRNSRSTSRPRWVGVAVAAAILLGLFWMLTRPVPPLPSPAPQAVHPALPPPRPPVEVAPPEAPREALAPPPPVAPSPVVFPKPPVLVEKPVAPPDRPVPASPFLVERTRSAASQEIEIVPEQGLLSRVSAKGSEPLEAKSTVQPSDTLTSTAGGSFVLPDGSILHLAPESQVRVSWSQTLACPTVDIRAGDALVDLGRTPKPIFVSHDAVGVRLLKSSGRVFVSLDQGSLRTTLLGGAAEVQTRNGDVRTLSTHQSLVLRDRGDALESVEKPDVSQFSTLDPVVRVPPGVAPPAPGADPKAPALGALASGLALQSYSYRVSGRETRDGVWSPAGIYTSTIESVTAARRADDTEVCHFQRGNRPWDELGKLAPGSRDARLVDLLRNLKVPHQLVQELAGLTSSSGQPRTEKVRDRICLVWDLKYSPDALRKSMETLIDAAVSEGRLQKPDYVYWETLDGGIEASALKFEPKLMKLVDRRKVTYSYKTVSGLDRKTYQLETTMEFFSHGVASFPLSPDLIKRLNLGPQ